MTEQEPLIDIHCHLLPDMDDGAKSLDESLAMARIAVADGISTIVATPHQLGNFSQNDAVAIKDRVAQLQHALSEDDVPLRVLPGADVRVEDGMVAKLRCGEVLTLADRGKHVLLELPHELYLPLEPVLEQLHGARMVGVLSHPERNRGILGSPELVAPLLEKGCLMQITAGSLVGMFGPHCQRLTEWMVRRSMVHFVATDAHGSRSRRPLMQRAKDRISELAGPDVAAALCCGNPARVVAGEDVEVRVPAARKRGLLSWLGWRNAG